MKASCVVSMICGVLSVAVAGCSSPSGEHRGAAAVSGLHSTGSGGSSTGLAHAIVCAGRDGRPAAARGGCPGQRTRPRSSVRREETAPCGGTACGRARSRSNCAQLTSRRPSWHGAIGGGDAGAGRTFRIRAFNESAFRPGVVRSRRRRLPLPIRPSATTR